MKIRRKGAGIGFTAVLLSALVATVAAPAVFGAVTVTSAGTIPVGGTSTGTATFTFTENAAACFNLIALPAAGPELQVVIKDSASGATVHFSGTPVITAPGSLGATAALAATATTNDTLNINFAGSDPLNIEQISISGLAISADSTAATGAVIASLTAASNERGCVIPGGTFPGDVGTTTATGTINAGIGAGSTSVVIDKTSTCNFAVTALPTPSNLVFTNENKAVTAASAVGVPGPGQQTLTIAATTNAHAAAEAVTQTVVNCNPSAIGSPGSVAAALTLTASGATSVLPGENNNLAGSVTLSDSPNGTTSLLTGQTLTFAISAPATGVVFSVAPPVTYGGDATGPAVCALSVDRKSCTVAGITDPVGTFASVTVGPTHLDVDATAPLGTAVKVTVTTSPSVAVIGSPVTIAFVGRVIVASAAQPIVFIGFNDQQTGMMTLVESGPGFFVAGVGGNNTFGLCPATGESFTRAPWAVVTVGDLKLLSGLVGATQVKGTLIPGTGVNAGKTCAYWTVFTASTVASTIEIRGSADDTTPLPTGANNGPRINVPNSAVPGTVQFQVNIGTQAQVLSATGFTQLVSDAIRAFKNNVTVTASSQPRCLPGATDCLAGNIVITETQNGQLKPGEVITVNILPRATTQRMDVLLQTTSTNQTPIVTTNASASGLLVTPVGVTCTPSAIFGIVVCNFAVAVTQQSFGPTLGTLTFSNIHYVVAADAVNGPVNVNVTGTGGGAQTLDAVVSNAIIGAAPVIIATKTNAASAVGKTQNGILFTVSTKVIHVVAGSNNIATIRIQVSPALIGKSVAIEVAHKTGTTWSAFTKITTRVIGGDGFAYYYASTHAAQWLSFRGFFAGDTTHGSSRSQTVQVHWVSP